MVSWWLDVIRVYDKIFRNDMTNGDGMGGCKNTVLHGLFIKFKSIQNYIKI